MDHYITMYSDVAYVGYGGTFGFDKLQGKPVCGRVAVLEFVRHSPVNYFERDTISATFP